jgi:hypothetical protein
VIDRDADRNERSEVANFRIARATRRTSVDHVLRGRRVADEPAREGGQA